MRSNSSSTVCGVSNCTNASLGSRMELQFKITMLSQPALQDVKEERKNILYPIHISFQFMYTQYAKWSI